MGHSRHPIQLSAALMVILAVNAAWLCLDHSVAAWDDAIYLTNSLHTYDALTENGLTGFGRQFLLGMSGKPPLIATLPTPVYLIAGRHPRAALAINLAFLVVTLIAAYLLAGLFADRTAGLIALCMAGTMPMVYGLSRVYLTECGLRAFVMLGLYILSRMDTGSYRASLALGTVCGFGMLMKTSFPLYVAVPVVWIFIRGGRATMSRRRLGAFLAPLLLIAGPWYAIHAPSALHTALVAGSAETARIYGTGGLAETARYLVNLANCGPALYFAALPVLAILCMGRLSVGSRRGILYCTAAASPVAFLALSHYRDLRYAAPIFPVIAVAGGILAAAGIARFPRAAIAVAILLVIGTADMLDATFGFMSRRFEGGGMLLSIPRFSYVRPPQRVPSPYRDVLSAIRTRGRWSPGASPRLVLGSDTISVNADSVGLAALAAHIPVDVATVAYSTPAGLPGLLASASYFAYVDNAADSPFNSLGSRAIGLVSADPGFRKFMFLTLPDGSRLHVLEAVRRSSEDRLAQSGGLVEKIGWLPECSVHFGDGIDLTGFSLQQLPGGIEARYRWHSWSLIPRDYWSFGHVLDDQGRVIAYLDHAILPNNPTSRWDAGDSAVEKVTIHISANGSSVPRAVRLGVFDRQSGDRVPILSSVFPLADAGTGTVAPVIVGLPH